MKKLAFVCVFLVTACTAFPQTERQRIAVADKALQTLVEETTHKRLLGQVSDKIWVCFKQIANLMDKSLDEAHATVDTPGYNSSLLEEAHKQTQRLELMLAGGEFICE